MPYVRTMKDGSKKTYYTSSEMGERLRNRILLSAIKFKKEILEKEKNKSKIRFSSENIINKKVSYV